jgi:hypothetical protein
MPRRPRCRRGCVRLLLRSGSQRRRQLRVSCSRALSAVVVQPRPPHASDDGGDDR